jgi:hypothetical protein
VGWHEARKKSTAQARHDTKLFRVGPAWHDVPGRYGSKPRPMGGHEPSPFMQARKGLLQGTKRPITHYGSHQPEPTTTSRPAQPTLSFATCQPANLTATQPTGHIPFYCTQKRKNPRSRASVSRSLMISWRPSTRPGCGRLPNPKRPRPTQVPAAVRYWLAAGLLACSSTRLLAGLLLAPRRGLLLDGWRLAVVLLAGWGRAPGPGMVGTLGA